MWNVITEDNIQSFMKMINNFHDSCIKEMMYISGAYVDKELSMYPVNDQRLLRVILQLQNSEYSMIELEFSGLKYLKLFPVDDNYTCEIMDSSLMLKNDCVYWADCATLSQEDVETSSTIICASKLRWRSINGYLGKEVFFNSLV